MERVSRSLFFHYNTKISNSYASDTCFYTFPESFRFEFEKKLKENLNMNKESTWEKQIYKKNSFLDDGQVYLNGTCFI